ncbi:hypothetical protein FGB62_77g020 [Gracilaria domingensis]|nr:hypothetical protein FGB62_77g020 [Gracilaria domingensis]
MTLVPKDQPGRYFEISVEASRMACAFNDGGENWDSRLNNNYLIGCPGKYEVSGGAATYVSPSDKDLKAMPTKEAVSVPAASGLGIAAPALPAVVQ